MQIDIGFGDAIVPQPAAIEYPVLLDFPAPVLRAYPKETVVAEKLEALTKLGLLNSRMKDYYDLALLARLYAFEGGLLVDAIRSTFGRRGTPIEADPVGLSETFISEPSKAVQLRAFFRRSGFGAQPGLPELVSQVRRFAFFPLSAAAHGEPLQRRWRPDGPWE